MTFEEAKKILEKEFAVINLHKSTEPFEFDESGWIEHEKPSVLEAFRVLSKEGYYIAISGHDYDMRKKRLEKEYEKNTKAPGPGEEQSKEGNLKAATKMFGAQAREIMRLNAENAELRETIDKMKEGNPAIKEALKESAAQFNDALLDEQAKKIKELTEENENWKSWHEMQNRQIALSNIAFRNEKNRLGKEIVRLNKVIYKKNLKIEEFRKESSRYLRGEVKMFVENGGLKKSLRKTESLLHDISEANSRNLDTCFKNEELIDELKKKLAEKTKLAKKYAKELSDSSLGLCKLEKQLKDKNAILSDVAEELRLSKIREKNLTESCQKYIKANEELKEKLANKVVDKIDAQALKSSESALAWKEKEIADLQEKLKSIYKNRHIERVYKKKLVEKDEVIDNLHKELKAQKGLVNHISKKYDGAKINLNLRMKECEKLKEALDEANKHQQQAYRSCTDKNNEIRALKLQISALEKRGNGIDWKRNADAIKLYVNRASHERLWNPISQDICNEKELSFIINHGGKRVKYALHFDGTDIVYECSDPDKKNNDLMVGADIAEEGGDNSGVIVLFGKDFIDVIKKMK